MLMFFVLWHVDKSRQRLKFCNLESTPKNCYAAVNSNGMQMEMYLLDIHNINMRAAAYNHADHTTMQNTDKHQMHCI